MGDQDAGDQRDEPGDSEDTPKPDTSKPMPSHARPEWITYFERSAKARDKKHPV